MVGRSERAGDGQGEQDGREQDEPDVDGVGPQAEACHRVRRAERQPRPGVQDVARVGRPQGDEHRRARPVTSDTPNAQDLAAAARGRTADDDRADDRDQQQQGATGSSWLLVTPRQRTTDNGQRTTDDQMNTSSRIARTPNSIDGRVPLQVPPLDADPAGRRPRRPWGRTRSPTRPSRSRRGRSRRTTGRVRASGRTITRSSYSSSTQYLPSSSPVSGRSPAASRSAARRSRRWSRYASVTPRANTRVPSSSDGPTRTASPPP